MKLSNYEMIKKDYIDGYQCVLSFDDHHELSIISGEGAHGNKVAPYEVAIFVNGEFAHLPGINETIEDDVIGYLTETDVNSIIKKLYFITGHVPKQV